MTDGIDVATVPELTDDEKAAAVKRQAVEDRRRRLTGGYRRNLDPEEAAAAKKVEKAAADAYEKNRKKLALHGIGNVKARPVRAIGPDGSYVTVDEREGRFQIMLRRHKNPWQPHMVHAAQIFERDYGSANYGMKTPSYAPKVDNSGRPDGGAPGVVARMRLDQLRDKIGADRFMILELYCGIGFTLAELHERRLGTTQSLGERLVEAISAAAAFYERRPPEPSRFFQRCDAFIKDATRSPVPKRGGNRTPRKRVG